MPKLRKLILIVAGVVLISVLAWGGVALGQPAGEASSPLRISITANVSAGAATYNIRLENTSSSDIADVYIAGSIPAGGEFLGEAGTPPGAWFRGYEAAGTPLQAAVWLSQGIRAKSSQGPFTYRVDKGKATDISAHAWVHWRLPADDTVLSPNASLSLSLAAVHNPAASSYNGNCLSCHADVLNGTTLSSKIRDAHAAMMPFVPGYVAAKGDTNENCNFCHSGADLRDHSAGNIRRNVNVESCVACHGPQGPGKKFYAR